MLNEENRLNIHSNSDKKEYLENLSECKTFIREVMIAKQPKSNVTEITGQLDVIHQNNYNDEQVKM